MLEQLYLAGRDTGGRPFADLRIKALSPGVTAEDQQDVAALAGYRPPRSQALPAGPEDLRRCPVSLCYRPGTAAAAPSNRTGSPGTPGTPAILANIEYVGQGSAGGFGTPAGLANAESVGQDSAGRFGTPIGRANTEYVGRGSAGDPGTPTGVANAEYAGQDSAGRFGTPAGRANAEYVGRGSASGFGTPTGVANTEHAGQDSAGRFGTPTGLANTEYVGHDAAGGSGTFFAHALLAPSPADLAAGLGGLLPIETWRSPVWTRRQSAVTSLPPLTGELPRGGVSPAAVQAFLAEHPLGARLPSLVTAVAAAQAGWGPPVLLVEEDSDRAALWIGAVSYLLPPRAAGMLAFTTYTADPAAAAATGAHLIGTVPEIAAELPLDLVHAFEIWDLPAGRLPEQNVLAVAVVTARVGVGAARALWQTAERFAAPDAPFDAWYGPLVAAAALHGVRLTPAEDRVVTEWIAGNVDRLPPAEAGELALRLGEQPQWQAEGSLPILFGLAWRGRNRTLCDEIRIRQIDFELARVRDGVPGTSAASRIESARVRKRVTARLTWLLDSAQTGEPNAAIGVLRLLDWSRRAGLASELGAETLVGVTERVLVPEVVTGRWAAGEADPLRAAMQDWLPVRRGFVAFLRSLAGDPPQQSQSPETAGETPEAGRAAASHGTEHLDRALDGPLGSFLRGLSFFEAELAEQPDLLEALWMSHARLDEDRQVPVLRAVLGHRGIGLPDAGLLRRVWPRGWSPHAMVHVAAAIPVEELDDPAVAVWILNALGTASAPEDIPWYVAVSRRLLSAPVAQRLSARCAPLAKAVELERRCRDARDFGDLEWIARQDSVATPMIAVMVAALLPDLVLSADLDPDRVCSLLELMYPVAMRAFLVRLRTPPLDRSGPGLMRIAGVFILAETRYRRDAPLRAELLAVVDRAAAELEPQEWNRVRTLILASRREVEDEFLAYEEEREAPRPWFRFGGRRRE